MTRDQIIEIALKQFAEKNYHGTTMRSIATEVGIKSASIYFFFKNKEELFQIAFEKLLHNHFDNMRVLMMNSEHLTLLEVVSNLLDGMVYYHQQHPSETQSYISLINAPPINMHKILTNYVYEFDKWLEEMLLEKIQNEIPNLSTEQAKVFIKQFLIQLDGLFWEINLYNEQQLQKHLEYAKSIVEILIWRLKHEQ